MALLYKLVRDFTENQYLVRDLKKVKTKNKKQNNNNKKTHTKQMSCSLCEKMISTLKEKANI